MRSRLAGEKRSSGVCFGNMKLMAFLDMEMEMLSGQLNIHGWSSEERMRLGLYILKLSIYRVCLNPWDMMMSPDNDVDRENLKFCYG